MLTLIIGYCVPGCTSVIGAQRMFIRRKFLYIGISYIKRIVFLRGIDYATYNYVA